MMTKPYRTGPEKRNDERLKSIIRDELVRVLDTQVALLEAFAYCGSSADNAYISGQTSELHKRIGVLRWLIAMYRPSDPGTVNQHNMMSNGETPT